MCPAAFCPDCNKPIGKCDCNACPKCSSRNIDKAYPLIICHSCGHSEPLMDFPISNSHHLALSGRPTPAAFAPIDGDKQVRITKLNREQWGAIQQTRSLAFNTRRMLDEHLTRTSKKVKYETYK